MTIRTLTLFLICIFLLASCGTKKKVVTKDNPFEDSPAEVQDDIREKVSKRTYKDDAEKYAATYAQIAKDEMRAYGIPASITLAQGILESGAGKGELTRKANNHFGIKCHGWKGGKVYHDDDEAQECFRKYYDAKYSFRDHSLFLTERSRYANLFKLDKDDYKAWAKGLRKAGYATDPKYPDKLIRLVERYELYIYDDEVLGNPEKRSNQNNNNQYERYTVQKGDTLYSIAKQNNISVERLKDYNKLTNNTIDIGQVLYVKLPKDF